MINFKEILDESVKNVNGGKILTLTDGKKKLTVTLTPHKDLVNVTLGTEYFVVSGKDAKDFVRMFND